MNLKPNIRGAEPADIQVVRLLLESCNLPCAGVEDQFEDAFVVAEHKGAVIGVAGIERYGNHGLLRSVAVSGPCRGGSVGRLLVEECLARAPRRGISDIYLLTTDAQGYFEAFEFTAIDRQQVPPTIARSPEFVSLCPETATVMVLLSPRPGGTSKKNH